MATQKQLQESAIRKIERVVRRKLNEAQREPLAPKYEKLKKTFDVLMSQTMQIFEILESAEGKDAEILFRKFEDEIVGPLGSMIDSVEYYSDFVSRFDKLGQAKFDRGRNRVGLQ